jgi:hypothetical protein
MRERDNVINLRLFWGGGREPYVLPSNKGEIRWMDANFKLIYKTTASNNRHPWM